MGGSYGGYLTTLLIGRTTRFAAAISERAFIDPVSFVGSSDIGWVFPDQYLGHRSRRGSRRRARMAAAHRASRRRRWSSTPRRTGAARSSRAPALYVELKRRGVPSELLLFPGEGHELSRSGRPRHRLARLEHVLRWWARWLPTDAEPGGRRGAGGAGRPTAIALGAAPDRRTPGGARDPGGLTAAALACSRGGSPDAPLVGAAGAGPAAPPSPATRPTGGWRGRPPSATSARSPAGGCRARSSTTPTAPPGRRSASAARREAFERVEFRPSVLRDVSAVDPSTTLLGAPLGTAAGLRADRVHPAHAHRRRDRRSAGSPSGSASRTRCRPWAPPRWRRWPRPRRAPGGGSSCISGGTGRPAPPSSSGPGRPATRRWC